MKSDVWSDGAGYEAYVGRWSRSVAREFLQALVTPDGSAWLDFGCGTGALSHAILAERNPRLVIGCDRSPGYVEFARRQTPDARVRFVVAEPPEVPSVAGGFDAVVSGLVLNFLPDPAQGVSVLATRVRSGGTVAAYVWDYAMGMQLMRVFWDAATALDPAARALDEGVRFPLCRPEPLRSLLVEAGLTEVQVWPIVVPTTLASFEEFWQPFLGGQGPAPGYAMSLPPERRRELRDAVRQGLPVSADGTIALTARAWAVRGMA